MRSRTTVCKAPTPYCHSEGSVESPGKAPLFVPQVRGSLDYARDDGALFSRHFDQVKRVEKSPNAKPYYRLSSTHTVIQSVAKNLLERLTPKAKQYFVAC